MTPDKIRIAVGEARAFIARAETLLKSKCSNYDDGAKRFVEGPWDGTGTDQPRLQGAVRRASMDLTRALADMRKP